MTMGISRKALNLLRFYLHRYLRYTPAMAVVLMFYISFTKFFASGPFYDPPVKYCSENWWKTLLHISVYTNPNTIVSGKSS
jgi:peptidoglycan/LPS O-acetylase OafA/YrhL